MLVAVCDMRLLDHLSFLFSALLECVFQFQLYILHVSIYRMNMLRTTIDSYMDALKTTPPGGC